MAKIAVDRHHVTPFGVIPLRRLADHLGRSPATVRACLVRSGARPLTGWHGARVYRIHEVNAAARAYGWDLTVRNPEMHTDGQELFQAHAG